MRRAGVAKDPADIERFKRGELPLSALFREASWDEALDLAAGGLASIRDATPAGAPSRLAGFGSAKGSNEEAYLFQKLVRTGFHTNNVDHCTRLCHASSVAALMEGIGTGAVTAPFTDALHADVVVIIGANPTENHPVAATYFKQAAKRGTLELDIAERVVRLEAYARVWPHGREQSGHIFDADRVGAEIFQPFAHRDKSIKAMDRTGRIGNGRLHVFLAGFHFADGAFHVTHIVEGIENPEDVDSVGGRSFDELIEHVVGIMPIAHEVLSPQQHLQLGFRHRGAEGTQPFPGILFEETQAGVEGCAAPNFQ